ncbi:ABC transporter substrate-binding protein/permease [Lacticaseibacillus songhuajiangensis]|jgi:polar amino acid transport system substrate-binding protein|uniref:ABC transporter substrate-binding protein/permease n=1 Tax=Lacticaseibacillus songhuajiangensis TaxID=1296539 RepID=UPI000F7B051D|nr:ABC transporter substrate-binding protein/permease [Lacticaseibacillus songhuajiangensis]
MKRPKLLPLLILSLIAFFSAFAPQTTHAAQEKTYTFGTDVTYAPFEFANKNNKYIGIDLDLINAIAKKEGFKVVVKPLGFNAAVQALEAKQIDGVIAGMTITPERKAKFQMSKPYYPTGPVAAVAKNSKLKSLKDLKGKRVAIKTGTAAADYANSIKKKYGFTTVTFDDSNNMYQDVATGNSVACFDDQPVLQYAIATGEKLRILNKPETVKYYGIATSKSRTDDLAAKINAGIKAVKADGTYDKIVAKYLGNGTVASQEKKNAKVQENDRSFFGLLKENWGTLMSGLGQTLLVTLVAIVCATLVGVLVGLLGVVPNKFARGVSITFIYIFRGLPLLVLALFIYTGIPSLTGTKIPAFVAGIITLTLNEGAYTAAFVKGGIGAVNVGQMEAARSLGLPWGKAMRRVILPQGIKIMVPSFINQFIITLKDTSILSIIGILELTQTGKIIIARNMEGFKIWTMVALIYLVIITVLTWLSKYVQKRMNA